MNSDTRTATELQAKIDSLAGIHNSMLYEARIIDKDQEHIRTKYFYANSPEQARLKALKICRFNSELKQAAYANVGLVSCQGGIYGGGAHKSAYELFH
jgi:hypothetical protein